ncbi:MAG: sigma-70 family RNA polymerase sigma factor [Acidimicrobiia bacterium]|nr:sigma-70 family RNA polymerase sigma factor [Acidimicrobiia bacterium]
MFYTSDVTKTPEFESVHTLEKAFARGEDQSLRAAYLLHGKLIYTYCRRTLDDARAEDVTQDVFVSAWRSRHRFDPTKGTLVAWLVSITKNRIVDNVRAERRHTERRASRDPADLPTDSEIDAIGTKLMIADALRSLSDRERLVVMLHYFEGLTHRQVADRMSIPLGTVKSDIRRSLLQMRHLVEPANE